MKKRWTVLAIAGILTFTLTGCLENKSTSETAALSRTEAAGEEEETGAAPGTAAAADTSNLPVYKFGNSGAFGEPAADIMQRFVDLVNEKIGDQVKFEFYPAEQLGNEITMYENMQVDLQQGIMTAFDTLANYSPDFNILSMAFSFESHDHLYNYLNSELAQSAFDKLEEQGIHVIEYHFEKNPRMIFGKKPIAVPADLKGVKFRIANIPIWEKNVSQMGATPTVVAWSEYPYALLQGVVDAGECVRESYRACSFYESCPYATLVDYAYPLEALSMSTAAWERLTKEQKKVVEECAAQAAAEYNERVSKSWAEDEAFLAGEGVTFVEFDKQVWVDQMAPLAEKLEGENFWETPGLYEKVQGLK